MEYFIQFISKIYTNKVFQNEFIRNSQFQHQICNFKFQYSFHIEKYIKQKLESS